MTSRPSIGRTRIGLLNTTFSASSALTWAGVALPDSRSLRNGCIATPPSGGEACHVELIQRQSTLRGSRPLGAPLELLVIKFLERALQIAAMVWQGSFTKG